MQGPKYFEKIAPLVEPLHAVECERDRAGNRSLHYGDLCKLLLLGLFHPVVDSQRGLQPASELESVQQRPDIERVSLGSLSEPSRVFDAELLKPIIEKLGQQLQPLKRDPRLADVSRTLTEADRAAGILSDQIVRREWNGARVGGVSRQTLLHRHGAGGGR